MPNATARERGTPADARADTDTNHNGEEEPLLLARPLALEDTSDFSEIAEYLGEWEDRGNAAGRPLAGNQIGPYCTLDLHELGGPAHRSITVRPTERTLDALRARLVTDDDQLHFTVVAHAHTGHALVIASHGKIIGGHWLAYVDPDTIPPNPYAQRDERAAELCEALRGSQRSPFVRRLPGGAIEITPTEPGTKLKALVDALGGTTLTWADGTTSIEPPRDSAKAREAGAQLERSAVRWPVGSAGGQARRARAEEPAQQALFSDQAPPSRCESAGAPVRRSTVEPAVLEVLSRVTLSDGLVVLPDQLERGLYEGVNKVLTALGGKWNRHRGGHVFPAGQPIAEELAAILASEVLARELTGYFPTPRALAEALIELADVHPEHLVLEPSAGRGAIADLLAEIVPADRLYLVERDRRHHRALEAAGYQAPQLICGDFLTTTALPERFERIVMNPPFEQRQDVAHLTRAYELLAPGGRLAAIASCGLAFRSDSQTRALRELIEQSDGGSITENPRDAFKESGTTTATVTVALTKPLA